MPPDLGVSCCGVRSRAGEMRLLFSAENQYDLIMGEVKRTSPGWLSIADNLESAATKPTSKQVELADHLGMALGSDVPAPVAAVRLANVLKETLALPGSRDAEIPESLTELEGELGISSSAVLVLHTSQEVSAWFAARYMLKTARGLRQLMPEVGDIVISSGWNPQENRVISSIRETDGRVYMKGSPPRAAWPNNLTIVERVGSPQYHAVAQAVKNHQLNSRVAITTDMTKFKALEPWMVKSRVPSPEAVRSLEDLLETGEEAEGPFQKLIEAHPSLMSSIVMGNWYTYVIPQVPLGTDLVPDFLVLGINSAGPQWVLVEIEAPRHSITKAPKEPKKGRNPAAPTLSAPTAHAVQQIRDWREWLTSNVAFAHEQLGLRDLNNRAPGLVIIGRADPVTERQPGRARVDEDERITIHSWDWLLRAAHALSDDPVRVSDFAVNNLDAHMTSAYGAVSLESLDLY